MPTPFFSRARLDHIIHFSRSSEKTWARFERMGFALSPEYTFSGVASAVHSRIVNLGHTRVELMALRPGADVSAFPPAKTFVDARGEGLFGLALTTPDADSGLQRSRVAGIDAIGEMAFDSNTDGSTRSYTLRHYADPNVGLSYIQAAPFSVSPADAHANSVTRVQGLVYVAADPSAITPTARFIGGDDVRQYDGALYWNDRSGMELSCLSPQAFNTAYGDALGDTRWPTAYIALIRFMYRDHDALISCLNESGVRYSHLAPNRTIVRREGGVGVIIEFVNEAPA